MMLRTMDRPILVSALVAAVGVSFVPAPAAQAHGRFPATGQIAFHPADPSRIVARTTFGLLLSDDGGGTWRWVCTTVTGARMTEDPTLVVTPDGSIVAALFDGLARGTGDGCAWQFPERELTDVVVIDQAAHPTNPEALFAVTSSGGIDNSVYASTDQGLTWAPTGDPIEPILFEAIAVAPRDPSRIYLSGAYPPMRDVPRMPFVHRSTDSGVTWERFAFADFGMNDRNIHLLGVDPNDAAHVLMHVQSEDDDRIVRSTDGGETWAVVASMPSVEGFAWSEDGTTAWVGGDEGSGLWRSDDGGATFARIDPDHEVGCLAVRGDELWACGNNFTDGFAIGRSTDGGASFEPMLVLADVRGMVECPPESDTAVECTPQLPDLISDLGLALDAGTSPDAGSGGPGGGGGCGCHAARPARGALAPALAFLAAGALRFRRRARR
jgi:photosystem II stability/assembly factor-like uncharacterized protein